MTGSLRLVDTGLADARWNVAVTAALLELHAGGRIPDTLRFHRYRRCLLVGASTAADDRQVVRRVTGGGTVAMTPGVLAWDLVTGRAPRREHVGHALAEALGRFCVAASFQPPGDVVADGRKVAGVAGAFEGSTRLHQGCLLVEGDAAAFAGRFCLPVRPVATLAELARPSPGTHEVADAIAAAFAAAFGRTLRREPLGGLERERAEAPALADVAP